MGESEFSPSNLHQNNDRQGDTRAFYSSSGQMPRAYCSQLNSERPCLNKHKTTMTKNPKQRTPKEQHSTIADPYIRVMGAHTGTNAHPACFQKRDRQWILAIVFQTNQRNLFNGTCLFLLLTKRKEATLKNKRNPRSNSWNKTSLILARMWCETWAVEWKTHWHIFLNRARPSSGGPRGLIMTVCSPICPH